VFACAGQQTIGLKAVGAARGKGIKSTLGTREEAGGAMANQECESEHEEIQQGVLAAVVRVAAVSAPGTRELVLEFDAARQSVERSARDSQRLEAIFAEGLSTLGLKRLVCQSATLSEPLTALRRSVVLLKDSERDLSEYQRLVLKAAEAAARAHTWVGLLSRRITYLERMALEEIRAALKEGDRG